VKFIGMPGTLTVSTLSVNDRLDLPSNQTSVGCASWDDRLVTDGHPRSRIGRPYRRLVRWARHTPNGEIALILVAVGLALVLVAVVLSATIV
jgi:hypothetical protein